MLGVLRLAITSRVIDFGRRGQRMLGLWAPVEGLDRGFASGLFLAKGFSEHQLYIEAVVTGLGGVARGHAGLLGL